MNVDVTTYDDEICSKCKILQITEDVTILSGEIYVTQRYCKHYDICNNFATLLTNYLKENKRVPGSISE